MLLLVLIPQMFVLFAYVVLLEDCGCACFRAAFAVIVSSVVWLSGKSFIPLYLLSDASVPGLLFTPRPYVDRHDDYAYQL